MQQVADWLEKLGLGQYAHRFAENPKIGSSGKSEKKPRPAQVWSGRRLPFAIPVPRSIKGQARTASDQFAAEVRSRAKKTAPNVNPGPGWP